MASTQIITDPDGPNRGKDAPPGDMSLVSWVVSYVSDWEDDREQNYGRNWDEYYRLWRGIWEAQDKTNNSERSRLINPALSQAIESAVAELEEASFGQGRWFDVFDDKSDEQEEDVAMFRDQLQEDLDDAGVPDALSEIFLNGALYGTGIGKIIMEEVDQRTIVPSSINDTDITQPTVVHNPTVAVKLIPVHPQEFVIDPAARTIDEAMGCAHITTVSRHNIEQKQKAGVYLDNPVGGYTTTIVGESDHNSIDMFNDLNDDDKVMLIEYHGFVPKSMMPDAELGDDEEFISLFQNGGVSQLHDEDLVEAIVTIANGTTLLKAIETPFLMKDRGFMAYQHDTVPNRFWGRGVAEKGYNPQKALDSELRGRIDAMALSIHPMMGIDATRIPRGGNFKVAPGRNIYTNGDPQTILRPFNFGQVNNNTFAQGADLERQVQMGTGSMDSATPIAENRRNETSSGMSMIMGGAIKRNKRTLANIQRNLIDPLIHKAAWRYIQFAPDRYPTMDVKFEVVSSLGIVARELEQQQLANLLNTVPPESPAFWMLLKAIYEHSSISNREEMIVVIEQMMEISLQKQAQPEEDPLVGLKKQEIQLDAQIEQAKIAAKEQSDSRDAQLELASLQLQREKIALELKFKYDEMFLDAKVDLAKMEQDSAVTATQMQQKEFSEQRSALTNPSTEKSEKAPVITINQGGGSKTVSVTRTENGLEGTVEEIDG